ncbi:SDR family NAD(P)-dependent oxidoreductase [Streptomyces oceani]|uniref:Short-chain dehydrogenase n=1 Tax=Streptomyces oceani TaxID=1075402 RepID=A0A1E7JYY4_9ACTN|nr:SDR family oxidoreductase [Streptomyces oceani]OEU96881.1 short-chain dehydrogenase [Streptomyces oceani]
MSHILVTGAASGIGRAVAEAFARPGDRLSLADIDGAKLTDLADGLIELTEQPRSRQPTVSTLRTDLTKPTAPEECVRSCWERAGPVDVLVNAAGVYPSHDMADLDARVWDAVFALNTRAPALATAELARRAIRAGRQASVVNISSGAALRSRYGGGPYASSKAALEMATRAAALELGAHGIRVNAVSPGFVPVDSDCNPVSAEYAAAVSPNPLGRSGTPGDIAAAVRWLAGPEAGWVTGEILRVDGGSSAGTLGLPRIHPAS